MAPTAGGFTGNTRFFWQNMKNFQDFWMGHYEARQEYMDFLASITEMQWFCIFMLIFVSLCAYTYWSFHIPWEQPKITNKVFFEISKKREDTGKVEVMGRVEFGLYGDACPKMTENFRQLCTGEARSVKGNKPLSYLNTWFHTVRTNFVIQGGDTLHDDGHGGEGIYGREFPDENHDINHGKVGLLAMAKLGRHVQGPFKNHGNSNGCQFIIHLCKSVWNDGYDCVFGEVLSGYTEVCKVISEMGSADGRTFEVGTAKTPEKGGKLCRVYVSDCGEIPFTPADTPSGLPLEESKKLR